MNVSFTSLVNLASESLGGTAVSASDEFFAPCKNLTRDAAAVFLGDKYTEQGKWMDGWESRRKREPGHDWCIVKLGLRGVVRGVDVDTSHFLGNFPEACSLEGTDSDDPKMAKWRPLAERTALRGGMRNLIAIADPGSITHLRLNIYPDGGVARLRVYGEVAPPALKGLVDLAALASGGRAICCSDMFFSHKDNLILPGRSPFMGGGWETKRRRGPG
ncbi:MAG: allantoicase, partial [Deltaproteobacteria bacterium]|nr:allantoicase [Deltaproteobacteria bacterium]